MRPTPLARYLAALAALACLLTAGRAAAQAPAGEKYALLVGVNQYSEEKLLNDLAYPERDVTELAKVLKEAGYQAHNVVLMTQAVGTQKIRFLPTRERVRMALLLLVNERHPGD